MSDHPEHLSPIEQALLELRAAEEAGVFERTAVTLPERSLARRAGSAGRQLQRWALVGLPAAACVALAVGAGLLWHPGSHAPSRSQLAVGPSPAVPPIVTCLTGPAGGVAAECTTHDLDADGDVDLRDLHQFQLARASSLD